MNPRIIIVEQDHIICGCLDKSLRKNMIRAEVFSSPVRAFELFLRKKVQKKPLDLIIMDCDMPMDQGQQIVAMIRNVELALSENQNIHPVRIIGTTTRAWYWKKDGRRDGLDDVVMKPVGLDWIVLMNNLV